MSIWQPKSSALLSANHALIQVEAYHATASAFAPGRVELLGNHTDYNEGLVLGAAIDRGLTVTGSARSDNRIRLSSDLMGQFEIALSDIGRQKAAGWANYALGVTRELIERGIRIRGFEARIGGNLSSRSGLSSSAALEVATALFLLKLHEQNLEPMQLARLCQQAEHRFAGVQSGLLDQVMSIFGKVNHLIFFDTRTEQVELISFPADLALIIAHSGKQRELSSGDYNLRREQTSAAAKAFGVSALRDVSLAQLDERTNLDPLVRRRARHVVGENDRVQRAITLVAKGDAARFGQLLNESHQSSRDNFENSTPELDLLVQLAQNTSGVLGARLTGAGFGGAVVALCERADAHTAARQLHGAYLNETGIDSDPFVCQIGAGAH